MSDIEKFESKWVEPILSIVASHVNMISSECFVQPLKVRFWLFLENLSKNIEIVMTKGVNIVLMGVHIEYKINRKPRLFPNHFALNVYCPTIPTRVGKNSETHIDYIITENNQNSFIFDIPFKLDHFASILFSSAKMSEKKHYKN